MWMEGCVGGALSRIIIFYEFSIFFLLPISKPNSPSAHGPPLCNRVLPKMALLVIHGGPIAGFVCGLKDSSKLSLPLE